jgi:large subunit ribosomal protein L22
MAATDTGARPGTRARVRHARLSASKARQVLDLVRGLPVGEAADVLRFTERGAGEVVARCLASAVANAQHNDELDPDTLYVSACYADEGPTLKRWRPRARGRTSRIRKRMCHITIIVSPMPPEMLARVEARHRPAAPGGRPARRGRRAQEARRARVARSRGERGGREEPAGEGTPPEDAATGEAATGEAGTPPEDAATGEAGTPPEDAATGEGTPPEDAATGEAAPPADDDSTGEPGEETT